MGRERENHYASVTVELLRFFYLIGFREMRAQLHQLEETNPNYLKGGL